MNNFVGLYIADTKSDLVFQYPFAGKAPSFAHVFSKVNTALSKQEELPVVIKLSADSVLYHVDLKHLTFFLACDEEPRASVSQDSAQSDSDSRDNSSFEENDYDHFNDGSDSENSTESENGVQAKIPQFNPLIPLEFLKQLVAVMTDYFGESLNSQKINANYDQITLLLHEMVENGYPYLTDLNQLKDTIHTEGILSRFLSSASSSLATSSPPISRFSSSSSLSSANSASPIPWRRKNVRHTKNELFVDFVETVTLVMSASSKHSNGYKDRPSGSSAFYSTTNNLPSFATPVIAKINGEVLITSRLSGVPDLQMILNTNGHDLSLPSFHPCVRIDKWEQSPWTFSFIPPDGKSKLCNYEIDLNMIPHTNRILHNTGIINAQYKTGLGIQGDEFEIIVSISNLKTVKSIDTLKIEINTELFKDKVQSIKVLRASQGDFQFSSSGKNEWIFENNFPTGVTPVFRGSIVIANEDDSHTETQELTKIFPTFVAIHYLYKGGLPSGMKVGSLKVVSAKGMSDNIKPYKGVKYIAKSGQVIFRSN